MVQKKKRKKREKAEREGRQLSSEQSLGAKGDLLQVMDALLVNHADVERVEIQDEALVQLEVEERDDTEKNNLNEGTSQHKNYKKE